MIRRTIAVAILAGLVLLGIAVFNPQPSQQSTRITTPEGSDYYMLDATVTQFDKQGDIRYRLKSDKTLHFPNDTIRLIDISVNYRSGKLGDWVLTAADGHVPSSSRDILLTGNVTLVRAPDSQTPLIVKTDHVWVRTQQGLAETNAVVRAHSKNRRIRGNGMTVQFDERILTLHDDVHITFTP